MSPRANQTGLHICVDVDGTLISPKKELRPGAREALEALRIAGHHVYLWSGSGGGHGHWLIEEQGVPVEGCYGKPPMAMLSAWRETGVLGQPDLVIDDDLGDVLREYGGIWVPYSLGGAGDGFLADAVARVRDGRWMTPEQVAILKVFRDYWSEHGYPPSVRDICDRTGRSSSSTIHQHLDKLVSHGYLVGAESLGQPRCLAMPRWARVQAMAFGY